MGSIEYYYRNSKDYAFHITDETQKTCPFTFYTNKTIWENHSINYFFDAVPTDKQVTIVDIGAQVGLYSLYAKFLPRSTFYAFEPFPCTYNLLEDNLKLNNIPNVQTIRKAVSDTNGVVTLNTCKSHNGLHTLGENVNRFSDIEKIQVETVTLDEYFYNNNIDVDFIKIDTEGHEYFILRGGLKTIQKNKPIIQIEWNLDNMAQCNVNAHMLDDLIAEMGYRKQVIIGEELFIIPV
jgi:FkbM family methyltransferase